MKYRKHNYDACIGLIRHHWALRHVDAESREEVRFWIASARIYR